jgi:hypothetical protein
MTAETEYQAKWAEYQAVMHRGAWRIGWGFFAVTVGLLPLMWAFIWMVGPGDWEKTGLHAPLLMWLAAPLCLGLVVVLILRLYRKNLELDAVKRAYLAELRAIKARMPAPDPPERPAAAAGPDPDAFQDDLSI